MGPPLQKTSYLYDRSFWLKILSEVRLVAVYEPDYKGAAP